MNQTKPATCPTGERGIAYVRVSKDAQDRRSQRQSIDKWLTARNIKVADTIEDAGSRDLSYKRTGFQFLLQEVQTGKVNWIVVAERDRFGVADNEEWGYYVTILRRHNCQLWSVADDKELTSRKDRVEPFMAAITSDRSRSEQEARGQREHRGKHALVQRGHWPGGKPPYGYDLVCHDESTNQELWRIEYEPGQYKRVCHFPDGTCKRIDGKGEFRARNKGEILIPEPTRDKVTLFWVRKIFEWFRDGQSCRGIASQLNSLKVPAIYKGMWLGPTITGILKNPIYVLGTPIWNKSAHGRFVEWVNGELATVERDGNKVKTGRKRSERDHVKGQDKPANAIIDRELWNVVQSRIKALAAAPKKERRPRNPELYLSGLVHCGDCGEPMVGWGQHMAYRCSTNMHDPKKCRCNKTRHKLIESLLFRYLEQTEQSLQFLYESPEHCREVLLLERQSEPLIKEYTQKLTAMWQAAKKSGKVAPADKNGLCVWTYRKLKELAKPVQRQAALSLQGQIVEKEQERDRLVKRLGMVTDEAAEAVAVRLQDVARELRELRDKAKPVTDALDALRDQLEALLRQTRQVRESMVSALPLKKGEYIRRVISRIVVEHVEVRMGRLRASRVVGVRIVPLVGEDRVFSPGKEGGIGEGGAELSSVKSSRGRG